MREVKQIHGSLQNQWGMKRIANGAAQWGLQTSRDQCSVAYPAPWYEVSPAPRRSRRPRQFTFNKSHCHCPRYFLYLKFTPFLIPEKVQSTVKSFIWVWSLIDTSENRSIPQSVGSLLSDLIMNSLELSFVLFV